MRRSRMLLVVGVFLILAGGTAQAALIEGSIAFGSFIPPSLVGPPGTDLSNNTGFDFYDGGSAIVNMGATGDFVPVTYSFARFYDFSFDPTLSGTTFFGGTALWTTPEPVPAFLLEMTSLTLPSRDANSLTLEGSGMLYGLGFDPTPALWTFTINQNQSISFSASSAAAPVPEPGTILLLGSGLVGLAGWGRKTFRK